MQTLADARAMLTEIGVGGGVWEEAMAEKEKWGSGLGEEETKGEEERGKTDGTEGWERYVPGGAQGGEMGPE